MSTLGRPAGSEEPVGSVCNESDSTTSGIWDMESGIRKEHGREGRKGRPSHGLMTSCRHDRADGWRRACDPQ
eukprot:4701119-Prymnesium_polylepis.1